MWSLFLIFTISLTFPSLFISCLLSSSPPPTPGHLLRDGLRHMCGGGPAVCRSHADRGALLLHVPLLWQLRRRDAPAPEEERRLPTGPAGNAALLHLAGHHVSVATEGRRNGLVFKKKNKGTGTRWWWAGDVTVIDSVVLAHSCTNTLQTHSSSGQTQSSAFPIPPPCCLLYIVKSYCRCYVAAPFILVFSLSTDHNNLQAVLTRELSLTGIQNPSLYRCKSKATTDLSKTNRWIKNVCYKASNLDFPLDFFHIHLNPYNVQE